MAALVRPETLKLVDPRGGNNGFAILFLFSLIIVVYLSETQ